MAVIRNLEIEALERRVAALGDSDLVLTLLVLLSGEAEPVAAIGPNAGRLARTALFEVGKRWVPPDVLGDAFQRLGLDGGDLHVV